MQGFDPGAVAAFTSEVIVPPFDKSQETKRAWLQRAKQMLDETDSADDQDCPAVLNERHVVWLVLYQFAGLSPSQIRRWEANRGRAVGADDDASVIRKGYQAAADRLGIVLKGRRRGRPAKTGTL